MVLSCRFQQCLDPFTMLLVERSSETGLFRHLSDHVLGVRNLKSTSALSVIFFKKYAKFILDFKNAESIREKLSSFWNNCIWIRCVKLSRFRREYLSSVVNVLTNRPKILKITKRDFSQLNCLHSDQQIW